MPDTAFCSATLPPGPTRRAALAGAAAALALPGLSRAAIDCREGVRVAAFVPLTGPLSANRNRTVDGLSQAVDDANAVGCAAALTIYDTEGRPARLSQQLRRAIEVDRAHVAVGYFSPIPPAALAPGAPGLVIIDLAGTRGYPRARNEIALPFEFFLDADPDGRGASVARHARLALQSVFQILAETGFQVFQSPDALVARMAGLRHQTPSGPVVLNPETRVFEAA